MNKKKHKAQHKGICNQLTSKESLLLFFFIMAFCLCYINIKVEQIRLGYQLSENSKKQTELLKEREKLQALYTSLKAPDRMEKVANTLGFRFPTPNDVIYVEKTTVVGNAR